MATQKFSNDASALLAASIDSDDLTIQVASGFGALFPSPGAGEFCVVALQNADGDLELCRISSRSGDNLTVTAGGRGFDGTTAQSWTLTQTRVELRLTRSTVDRFLQIEGGVAQQDITIPNLTVTATFTADDLVLTGSLTGVDAAFSTSLTVASVSVRDASNLFTSGNVPTARLGSGTANGTTFLAGDQSYKAVPFTSLSGVIASAQVPESVVTQHQAALLLFATQLTAGTLLDARVALSNVSQHQASLKTRNVTGLAGTAVTLQADPGGTPSGSPGDVFYYY